MGNITKQYTFDNSDSDKFEGANGFKDVIRKGKRKKKEGFFITLKVNQQSFSIYFLAKKKSKNW